MNLLEIIAWAGAAVAFLLALWAVAAAWVTSRHRITTLADERHAAVTDDGWILALHRYLPRTDGPGRGPVLLCHGLLANRANHDIDDRRSLARYLAGLGFDAWVLELRGAGLSRDSNGRRGLGRITFDDYVERDIPAAIRTVLQETGWEQLQWVGHSMGGMLLYAHLSSAEDRSIAAAVTVASPIDFTVLSRTARHLLALRPLLRLRWVPLGHMLRGLLPLLRLSRRALLDLGLVPSNLSSDEIAELLVNVIEGFGPAGVLEQFGHWVEEGVYVSRDGRRPYGSLEHLRCPLLIIQPSMDFIAPPASVRPALDLAPATDKTYRLFGKVSGDDRDYGHGDILLSDAAREKVFPLVGDWLVKHAPSPPQS